MAERSIIARLPLSRNLLAWGIMCGFLALGSLLTLVDLMSLDTAESRRANEQGQRAIIDPLTGQVAFNASAAPTVGFDVVSDKPATEATPEPDAAGEPAPDAPAPADAAAATPEPEGTVTHVTSQGETLPKGLPTLRTAPLSEKMPPASLRSGESLVPAPAPEITEKRDGLSLPKRNSDSVRPSSLYARKFTRTPEQQLVSIVILDAGLSAQSLPLILTLPKDVTIAYSPYAADAQKRIGALRRAGYEAWGVLPAMSARYPQDDPGPLGLVTSLPKDELLRRLRSMMAETIGSVGLVLPANEILSSKPASFAPVTSEIEERGLYLFAAAPTADAAQLAADRKQTPATRRADLVIDSVTDDAEITANLAKIDALLEEKGQLIVVSSARPQSLLALQRWFKERKWEEPATLAPLSAHYLPKEAPAPAPAPAEAPAAKKSSGGH